MKPSRGILYGVLILIAIFGFAFLFGWTGVFYTKTVGKAQQNANREVYEQTNSFTKAKREECIKYYKEYQNAKTDQEREGIRNIVAISLADFDEDTYIKDTTLLAWVKEMKY